LEEEFDMPYGDVIKALHENDSSGITSIEEALNY